ncbi:DUF3500 domain-containing protein [Schlesneria sp. T3-172]|uniref:DUF3500 domain-containing protein n=1 Tax=Schlesneria TaxID=656899 RepID=UPI002EE19292
MLKPEPSSAESSSAGEELIVGRRTFLQSVGGAVVTGAAAAAGLSPKFSWAAPTPKSAAETCVAQLYQSLSKAQKEVLVFPFEHELRKRISANWHITKPIIRDDFYTDAQRKLVTEIVRNVTSPDGFERLEKQTEYDDGGFGGYSIALFGNPESGPFQFELTGRHLTLRADGDSVDKVAFGGPIIYGHGEEDPDQNLFLYQTKQVNEVFKALDPKQAEAAIITKAPSEAAVALQGPGKTYPGIAYTALTRDQQELVEKTLKVLLAPYRQEDVDEVFAILKATGGMEQLHFAFYQEGDLLNDRVWDIWRVEGPSLVWHFRGAPHVHAYINIGIVG